MLNINQMQKIESNILREFVKYCESNDLRYFMAYGTLLGTVRHRGFIPWDDDVDVMMPREDYERLLTLGDYIGGVRSRYKILSSHNRKDWPYLFAKCIDTMTEMEESTYKSGKIGVYIDIFPIDGLPDNKLSRNIHMARLNFCHYLLITIQKNNLKGQNGIRSIVKAMLFPIAKAVGMKRLLHIMEKIIRKYRFDNSIYIASQTINTYGMRECIEKKAFSMYEMMEFDGYPVRVPVDYEKVLTQLYGNYMELPPEDKRVSHHSYQVKLVDGFDYTLVGDVND